MSGEQTLPETRGERVSGWKAIAVVLGHDPRTVMRWETMRNLPVYRTPGDQRGPVFAYRSELQAWLHQPDATLSATSGDAGCADDAIDASAANGDVALLHPLTAPHARPRLPSRWVATLRRPRALTLAGLLAVVVVAWAARPEVSPVPVAATAPDPVARDLYLRGRAALARRTPTALHEAIRLFGESVARDPRGGEALAGLADAWLLEREFDHVADAIAWPRATAATDAALAVNPLLVAAIRARGFIDFWWLHDHPRGLTGLARAVTLGPDDPQSHHWYATALAVTGAHAEALREIEAARALAPADGGILADRGLLLLQAGKRSAAIDALREVVAAAPEQSGAQHYLGDALLEVGDLAGFTSHNLIAARLRGDVALAAVYTRLGSAVRQGWPQAAPLLAQTADAAYLRGEVTPYTAARLLAMGGNLARARTLLAVAAAQGDPSAVAVAVDPWLQRAVADAAAMSTGSPAV